MVTRWRVYVWHGEIENSVDYDNGEWVTYDDYAALEARVVELERELSDAESDIDTMACQILELTRGESK